MLNPRPGHSFKNLQNLLLFFLFVFFKNKSGHSVVSHSLFHNVSVKSTVDCGMCLFMFCDRVYVCLFVCVRVFFVLFMRRNSSIPLILLAGLQITSLSLCLSLTHSHRAPIKRIQRRLSFLGEWLSKKETSINF